MAAREMWAELTAEIRSALGKMPGPEAVAMPLPGLLAMRVDWQRPPKHHLARPALCIVAQGAKQTVFGDQRYVYRAGQALLVSVEAPAVSTILEASAAEPYLALAMELDLGLMREVMEGLPTAPPPPVQGMPQHGVLLTDFSDHVLACILRLLQLRSTPEAVGVLQPAILREIAYWLLTGPHAGAVTAMTVAKAHPQPILRAIHRLRERFAEAVRIGDLASMAGMSLSTFHRHFKALTSMTPLQYQKQFRLLEARRRLLADEVNVETAAFGVGYESASQFSREYVRMFGVPPRRDVVLLKQN